jgi:hypothetical protein
VGTPPLLDIGNHNTNMAGTSKRGVLSKHLRWNRRCLVSFRPFKHASHRERKDKKSGKLETHDSEKERERRRYIQVAVGTRAAF